MRQVEMSEFALLLPPEFDDYEWEATAKGWFSGAVITDGRTSYPINFYDPVRLTQEVGSALESDGVFVEENVVVVNSVTRAEINKVADYLLHPRVLARLPDNRLRAAPDRHCRARL